MDQLAYEKIKRNQQRIILSSQPFFGVMLGYLKLIEVPEGDASYGQPIDTMATNGDVLLYSAKFVNGLPDKELQGVLVHEVLHNCFEHHLRRRDRNAQKWNIAADYVINIVVKDAGFELPENGYLDYSYRDMTTEEVYAKLPDGEGGGQGFGEVFDGAKSHDTTEIDRLSQENKIRITGAAAMNRGKAAGSMPSSLQRLINDLLEPKVDWASQFRNMVTSMVRHDYSFSRPNRRFIHQGIYLPGKVADAVGHVAVAVDTSGSINNEILDIFGAEIRAILDEGVVEKVTVIWADAKVQHVQTFETGDELVLEPKGGGGTAFSDTFNWIEQNLEDVDMVVYLTDLEVHDFGEAPDCPVVWTVYGTRQRFAELAPNAPFGTCLHIEP